MNETEPTAEDHAREARRYAERAEEYEGADGYTDQLRRSVELQAAQVHATLAAAATQRTLLPKMDAWMALAFKDAPAEGPAS